MNRTIFRPAEESKTLEALRSAARTLQPTQEGSSVLGELVLDANDTPRLLHHPRGISAEDFLFFAENTSGPTKAAVRRARSLLAEQARQAELLIIEGDSRLIPRSFIKDVADRSRPPEGLGIITLEICRFVLDHTMPVDTPS